MKPYADFQAKKSGGSRETLPVGGYVCQIQGARVEEYGEGRSSLVLAIDVVEGEYAGIWKRDFDNNQNEDRKWRGVLRVNIPSDDGSEQDGWNKRRFGNLIWCIEASNPGYGWDWDEKKLKGKKIGVIYRNREWEYNGRSGWTTEAGGAASVDEIRDGKFKPLPDRPLRNRPAQAAIDSGADENDLPF